MYWTWIYNNFHAKKNIEILFLRPFFKKKTDAAGQVFIYFFFQKKTDVGAFF